MIYYWFFLLLIAAFGAGVTAGLWGCYKWAKRKGVLPAGASFREWVFLTLD